MKNIVYIVLISLFGLVNLTSVSFANSSAQKSIHLLAGYGAGDNSPASQARLVHPSGIAFDLEGNILVSEREKHRIRKIDADGIIHRIAGIGSAGIIQKKTRAIDAHLNVPAGLTVDALGNIYFADQKNHLIQKIDIQGHLTTIAGTGYAGYSGDNGMATQAQLNLPTDVKMDHSGYLYIADRNNHRIRRISPKGIITTFAGTGKKGAKLNLTAAIQSELFYPSAMTFDDRGNLLVADSANNRILKISSMGHIQKIAGTGKQGKITINGQQAIDIPLSYPNGIAFSASSGIYIADSWNNQIIQVNRAGQANVLFADKSLNFPTQLSVDKAGTLYIVDSRNNRLLKSMNDQDILTIAGKKTADSSQQENPLSVWLNQPTSLLLDSMGNIFIVDKYNHQIRKISPMGVITTVVGTGEAGYSGDGGLAIHAKLHYPNDIALDADGNLYIADTLNHRIRKVTPEGIIHTITGGKQGFSGDSGKAIHAQLSYPVALAVSTRGEIYIADQRNHRVRMIDAKGIIHTVAGNGRQSTPIEGAIANKTPLLMPSGLALNQQQQLYIADAATHKVYQLIADNKTLPLGRSDHIPNQSVQINIPLVQRIITVVGTGQGGFSGEAQLAQQSQLYSPHGLFVDQKNQLIIADTNNHRIRLLGKDGKLYTLAGEREGYAGDSSDEALRLSHPQGVFVGANNTLMIADTGNDRIRYITRQQILPPSIAVKHQSSKSVTIGWQNNGTDLGGYWLERKAENESEFHHIAVLSTDTSQYIDRKVTANTAYSYRLRYYSPLNLFSPYSQLVQVNLPDNHLPRASISVVTSMGADGVIYSFNGLADAKDGVKSWYWNFGDGMGSPDQNALHSFAEQGFHTITLTVTDTDGDISEVSRSINVGHVVFSLTAGKDQSVNEGENIIFNGQFTHPNRAEQPLIMWNFGDGLSSTGSLSPTHQYAVPGTYQVTLMIMDSGGKILANHTKVTVLNTPPKVSLGDDYRVKVGETFQLTADASDAGNGVLSYHWDLGDGYQQSGQSSLEYQYLTPGVYRVNVKVIDQGKKVATDSLLVHVFQKYGQTITQALDYKDLQSQGRDGSALLISYAGPAHLYLSDKNPEHPLRKIDFGTDFLPLAIRGTRDFNKDAVEELIILGLSQHRQTIGVKIMDPLTGLILKKYELGLPEAQPTSKAPSIRMEQSGKDRTKLSYELPLP